MAIIIKAVAATAPREERTQTFTQSDAASGDILDLFKSLGKPAQYVRIRTASSSNLTVRLNVLKESYPVRNVVQFNQDPGASLYDLRNGPVLTVDPSIAPTNVGIETVLEGKINTLEVSWSTGTWEIFIK